jgi:hypothetical protein
MKKLSRLTMVLAGSLGLAASSVLFAADTSGEMKITLPAETARFKPGPEVDTASSHCMICHSADYIYTQPPLTRAQWTATVMKMKKVYGAPIQDSDVDAIVNYLLSQNGKE